MYCGEGRQIWTNGGGGENGGGGGRQRRRGESELGETAAEWIGLGGERRGVQEYRAYSVRPETILAGPKNFPPHNFCSPKFFQPARLDSKFKMLEKLTI